MKKLLLLIIVLVIAFLWVRHELGPVDNDRRETIFVTIKEGSSLSDVASTLSEKGLIRSPFIFKQYARFTGSATKLQAGTFALRKSESVDALIAILRSGKSEEVAITVPEGYTVADIDALLVAKGLGQPGDIIHCAFTCDFNTFDFLPVAAAGTEQTGIGSRLEGYLFPETYYVSVAEYHPKFLLERMLGTFRKRVIGSHAEELKNSGHSLADIVTMASLVEEESRNTDERPIVAGILWKRLKGGVVLGVDATTRYALKKKTEPLTYQDVEADSPYNTRRKRGLPPTPIANPGDSAIAAALAPKESSYWYYLHDKTGMIHYAVTNDEHNVNRGKYLR